MLVLSAIPAFNDNYIWCIHDNDSRQAIVVDPGSAEAVTRYLQEHNLNLEAILLTHHHPDHCGGINELKQNAGIKVYGSPNSKFPGVDIAQSNNETFTILGTTFKVIDVPGHTLDHIAFYSEADQEHASPWLFCGDTLFSGGCGRLFEGTPTQMHLSLASLKALPAHTLICCAHEYTLANLDFAKSLMPQNQALKLYTEKCIALRASDKPTLPSTLKTEQEINPFLRENDPEIINSLKVKGVSGLNSDVEVWTEIRRQKDVF